MENKPKQAGGWLKNNNNKNMNKLNKTAKAKEGYSANDFLMT